MTPMPRIAVFGATGLTGGLVVRQALAQGHEVAALVRDPARVTLRHPSLIVMAGSPTSMADVERCVQGASAVIHCLGIGGKGDGRPSTLVSDSAKAVLAAMQRHGTARIVCMSNVGAGGQWHLGRQPAGHPPVLEMVAAHHRGQEPHGSGLASKPCRVGVGASAEHRGRARQAAARERQRSRHRTFHHGRVGSPFPSGAGRLP